MPLAKPDNRSPSSGDCAPATSGAFDPFPRAAVEQTIAARFEQISRRYPGRLALQTDTRRLSYEELNRAANRISRAVLDRRGEGPEPIVVLMERDAPLVASVIALAKAGKICVCLDPSFPEARLASVLADCQPRLILTSTGHEALAERLSSQPCGVLNAQAIDSESAAEDPGLEFSPDTFAYILYTSGSTGRPKGVVHSHFGLLHQIRRHTNALRICVDDRVTMLGSVSAAQANTQLYVALLNGAALFPKDLKQDGLADLAEWLTRERITYYRSSASIFRHWAKHLSPGERCPTLRLLAVGGEPVYRHDFELYRSHFLADCLFVNTLSTTETGTLCIHLLDRGIRFEGNIVPVGYPVDDTDVFLVNEAGVERGEGEIGEIAARSRGLAAGYWGQEALTRAEFLPHPDDGRLRTYRTGDLGRMSADGAFVCLGRRDSLVKISGHRVDIGEVETALRGSDMVRQVAVVDREHLQGEKRLVAYVVPIGEPPLDRAALRRFLKDRLPEHMVPSGFQPLDALPLTPSGKIDRQALPPFAPSTPSGASVGHLGLLGTQIRVIWEDLLGLTGVGSQDDFMDMGGNSLLGIEMLLRIEKVCGRTVAPSRLLGGAITIDRLVHLLMNEGQAQFGLPLAAVQGGGARRPLFFLHGDHENGGLYCHELARSLGPDQPFYAVTPHGLDGDELPWSLEVMASDRLSAVRAVQPTGPYRLGGFCTGGIIAFEMARQLEARGERVEALLLIDAALENGSLPLRVLGRASRAVGALLRWSEATRRQNHLRLRSNLLAYARSARSGPGGLVRFLAEVLRRVRRRLVTTAKGDSGATPIGADIGAYLTRHLAYGARRRDYVPGRFTGRIALFRSDYLLDKPPGGPTAGWHHVAAGVDVHWLPGNHESAVTQHVAVVAEKMKAYLA